jgi:hypothetical protein
VWLEDRGPEDRRLYLRRPSVVLEEPAKALVADDLADALGVGRRRRHAGRPRSRRAEHFAPRTADAAQGPPLGRPAAQTGRRDQVRRGRTRRTQVAAEREHDHRTSGFRCCRSQAPAGTCSLPDPGVHLPRRPPQLPDLPVPSDGRACRQRALHEGTLVEVSPWISNARNRVEIGTTHVFDLGDCYFVVFKRNANYAGEDPTYFRSGVLQDRWVSQRDPYVPKAR